MAGEKWTADSTSYITPRGTGQGDAWSEDAARQGGRGAQRLVEVGEVAPPASVASVLGLSENGTAVVRRRLILLDDRPVELTDSYYPASIARGTGLAERKKIRGGAVTLLAELGHTVRHVVEDVTVDDADEATARSLELPAGAPVLVLTRTSQTPDGTPVEVSVMTMPRGAHLTYRTEIG